MKIILNIVVVILVLLAVLSGVTKVMLMPQDVEFFGQFGFTDPLLIAFGALQVLGGVLLAIRKFRMIGSLIVAVTFVVSAVVLFMAGSLTVALVTLAFVALLGFVGYQTRAAKGRPVEV